MLNKVFSNRFHITKILGESKNSIVYKAFDIKDKNKPIAIKFLKNESISHRLDDIIRFQSEANTISKLFHPNITKIYELGENEGLHYIVMEYFEGKSLSYYIENDLLNNHEFIVDIIIKICEPLEYIHSKNIIHRDIKPGNILISFDKASLKLKELKIIDFGLAQLKKTDEMNINEIAGTLNYIAPEQTGLLKKQVDERSDLYSVGILFYQMLAKRLPFCGQNLSSIIHQHIAKKPESLNNIDKNIPQIIEKMIFKLLEKEQDNRYQSAGGLLKDLIKYKKSLTDFILGLDDKVLKLHYRTRLIGREKEFNRLKSAFNNVINNKGSIFLIKGEAGIGKSRLVEELKDYVSGNSKIFIEGKSFIGRNKIPYGPFKDVLNGYIKNFIYYTNAKKNGVREKLRENLMDLGEIILKLNPQMKEVIGEFPSLIQLETNREHQRFITFSSQFFLKLSQIEDGLILYIDDIQWLDNGSFELLSEIASEISKYPLLIIGAYRDNEIIDGHGLLLFKKKCIKNSYPLTEITVDYFDKDRMNEFICNLLFVKEENTEKISEYILHKSKGNPFFSIEILKQMITEKAIFQDNSKWVISGEILNKMEIFTNIIDILLKRISLLEESEIKLLSYAAVIGRKFDIELLFKLGKYFDLPEEANKEIIRIVERAEELQLLEKDIQVKGRILFVHDRIKEAFYQKIGDKKKKELHNIIGYTIEEINKDSKEDEIFDLAHHFIEAGNNDKIIEYAFPAGIKSKENHANEEAIKYLIIIKEILEKKGVTGNNELIKINEVLTDAYLTVGKIDEAIIIIQELLIHKKNNLEKAKLFRKLGTGYFKKGNFKECEIAIKKGIELLGENIPLKKFHVFLYLIKELLIHIFFNLLNKVFKSIKKDRIKPKYKELLLLYIPLGWIYILNDVVKFINVALHVLHLIFFNIGESKELGISYIVYASLCMGIPLKKVSKKYHLKSIKINKELKYDWGIALAKECFGYYYTWDEANYQKAIGILKKAKSDFTKIGDIWEIGMCDNGLGFAYHYQGNYDQSIIYFNSYLKFSKTNKDNYGISTAMAGLSWNYTEMGEFDKAQYWIDLSLSLSEINKNWYPNCFGNIYNGILEIEKNYYKKSIEYLEKAKYLYENNNFLKDYTILVYPFITEAYIEYYKSQKNTITQKEKKSLFKNIKKNLSKARLQTFLWINHYCSTLRIIAKYYELKKNNGKAKKYFLKSIELSKRIDRKFELAKSYLEYGNFLKNLHKEKESIENWKKSYSIFEKINSKHYVNKIKELLNIEEKKQSPIEELINRLKNEQTSSNLLDLIHDIISSEELYILVDKIMGIILEMTNAQRGFIILRDKKTKILQILISKSINKKEIPFENFSLSIIYNVLNSGETIITNNAMNDEIFSQYQSIIKYGINSVLCFPIIYKNNIKGVCYLDNNLTGFDFIKDNIKNLNLLITHLILSTENNLYNMSNKMIDIDMDYLNQKSKEFGLTNREKEILSMVIKDFTNKEICNKFYISLSTLRTHLNNIYRKTNAGQRDNLILIFTKINKFVR